MVHSENGKYYTIAANWETVSDEEVADFKQFLAKNTGIYNVKLVCQKEWLMGTFIDIYTTVNDGGNKYHLRISRDDFISDGSHEDEDGVYSSLINIPQEANTS